ncbi:leucine-rich repeat domain-containing protein [Candidatus Deianiraea vastatrix]|nr:hypothetical protein [Candidatus Deianiraea vastatrix]
MQQGSIHINEQQEVPNNDGVQQNDDNISHASVKEFVNLPEPNIQSPLEMAKALINDAYNGNNDVCNLSGLGLTDDNLQNLLNDDNDMLLKLKTFEKLDLSLNNFTNLKNIERLENLKNLDLSGCNISNINGISKLTNLCMLSLVGNPNPENCQEIAQCKKLTGLACPQNIGHGVINQLPQLTQLSLQCVNNGASILEDLDPSTTNDQEEKDQRDRIRQQIVIINLHGTKMQDENMEYLTLFENLTGLNISNNPDITIDGIGKLNNLHNLKILHMVKYYPNSDAPEEVEKILKMPFIRKLDILKIIEQENCTNDIKNTLLQYPISYKFFPQDFLEGEGPSLRELFEIIFNSNTITTTLKEKIALSKHIDYCMQCILEDKDALSKIISYNVNLGSLLQKTNNWNKLTQRTKNMVMIFDISQYYKLHNMQHCSKKLQDIIPQTTAYPNPLLEKVLHPLVMEYQSKNELDNNKQDVIEKSLRHHHIPINGNLNFDEFIIDTCMSLTTNKKLFQTLDPKTKNMLAYLEILKTLLPQKNDIIIMLLNNAKGKNDVQESDLDTLVTEMLEDEGAIEAMIKNNVEPYTNLTRNYSNVFQALEPKTKNMLAYLEILKALFPWQENIIIDFFNNAKNSEDASLDKLVTEMLKDTNAINAMITNVVNPYTTLAINYSNVFNTLDPKTQNMLAYLEILKALLPLQSDTIIGLLKDAQGKNDVQELNLDKLVTERFGENKNEEINFYITIITDVSPVSIALVNFAEKKLKTMRDNQTGYNTETLNTEYIKFFDAAKDQCRKNLNTIFKTITNNNLGLKLTKKEAQIIAIELLNPKYGYYSNDEESFYHNFLIPIVLCSKYNKKAMKNALLCFANLPNKFTTSKFASIDKDMIFAGCKAALGNCQVPRIYQLNQLYCLYLVKDAKTREAMIQYLALIEYFSKSNDPFFKNIIAKVDYIPQYVNAIFNKEHNKKYGIFELKNNMSSRTDNVLLLAMASEIDGTQYNKLKNYRFNRKKINDIINNYKEESGLLTENELVACEQIKKQREKCKEPLMDAQLILYEICDDTLVNKELSSILSEYDALLSLSNFNEFCDNKFFDFNSDKFKHKLSEYLDIFKNPEKYRSSKKIRGILDSYDKINTKFYDFIKKSFTKYINTTIDKAIKNAENENKKLLEQFQTNFNNFQFEIKDFIIGCKDYPDVLNKINEQKNLGEGYSLFKNFLNLQANNQQVLPKNSIQQNEQDDRKNEQDEQQSVKSYTMSIFKGQQQEPNLQDSQEFNNSQYVSSQISHNSYNNSAVKAVEAYDAGLDGTRRKSKTLIQHYYDRDSNKHEVDTNGDNLYIEHSNGNGQVQMEIIQQTVITNKGAGAVKINDEYKIYNNTQNNQSQFRSAWLDEQESIGEGAGAMEIKDKKIDGTSNKDGITLLDFDKDEKIKLQEVAQMDREKLLRERKDEIIKKVRQIAQMDREKRLRERKDEIIRKKIPKEARISDGLNKALNQYTILLKKPSNDINPCQNRNSEGAAMNATDRYNTSQQNLVELQVSRSFVEILQNSRRSSINVEIASYNDRGCCC